MPNSIQPTNMELSRSRSLVGFMVRTEGNPGWFEIALASDPALFDDPSKRTNSNFFSTRGYGALKATGGDAVWVASPQVLQRFLGQDRLYYALATFTGADRKSPQIVRLPADAMPYIRISRSFTGEALRSTIGVPTGRAGLANEGAYSNGNGKSALEWAGDNGANSSNGSQQTQSPAPAQQQGVPRLEYDDGFGADLWSRAASNGNGNRGGAVTEIASEVVGAVMKRVIDNHGDVSWRLEQLEGYKHPNDNSANAGSGTWQHQVIRVTGPTVENLIGDAINANFEVAFDYNGRSLGNVYITNTGTNDAVGWGLTVHARIMDDASVYPNASDPNSHAGLRVQFRWEWTRTLGSDVIAISELRLFGNGTYTFNHRTEQSSTFGVRRRGGARPFSGGSVVPIASAIAGAVMKKVLDNRGDVEWELEQLEGIKHPNDNPANAGSGAWQHQTIRITGPTVENLIGDAINANFEVVFDYNGRSLGNVYITNVGTNDAVGWGLKVEARIMNDAALYPNASDPNAKAAIRIQFRWYWTRTLGSDVIAISELHLFGDGTYTFNHRTEQSSAFSMRRRGRSRPFNAAVVPIASAIVGAVMKKVLDNRGDVEWELEQLEGIKHPNDNPANAGSGAWQHQTIRITGPTVENLIGDAINANFEVVFDYNGRSLGNVYITNIGTNDAVGWGLKVEARIMNDAALYPNASDPNAKAAIRIQFRWYWTRTLGSDVIAISELHLFGDGTYTFNHRTEQSSTFGVRRARQMSPAVIPIATAIVGAVMERVLDNRGDIEWELDQLKGIKHPNDNPASAGNAAFQHQTIRVTGPTVENLIGDAINANFEVAFDYNGRSLGNVYITNTGTNDAVGWGLKVEALIMNDAAVYPNASDPNAKAAVRVQFRWYWTRTLGSDVIAISMLHLFGDGTYTFDHRTEQSSTFGVRRRGARPFSGGSVVPIASAIVGAVMKKVLDNRGDVEWELEQLEGIKHPNDNPANAGSGAWQHQTIRITGPTVENLIGDAINANFEVVFDYNGRSLGNVYITNVGTNDAVGWGLKVEARIMNDAALYPNASDPNAKAAIRIQFRWYWTRTLGSDVIAISELHLFGDGTYTFNHRTEQSSAFSMRRRGRSRPFNAAVVPIASAIVGAVMKKVLDNRGDVEWELEQLEGIKHPNDNPANAGSGAWQHQTIRITGPTVENLIGDAINANFEVVFDYNGRSLGNVYITNVGTNDAVGWGLKVEARIMNDAALYPNASDPNAKAAIRIQFRWYWTRTLGSDVIAISELHLFGDGTYTFNHRTEQSSTFGVRRARQMSPVVIPIATAIVGAVMERVLDNRGDVEWELDQLKGIKHPNDNPASAGNAAFQHQTIRVTGPTVENLIGDAINANFEVAFDYNGRSLGNVYITNTGTNDAVGWGLKVEALIMNDAAVYPNASDPNAKAAVRVQFRWYWTRTLGSDVIAISMLHLFGDGTYTFNHRTEQSSTFGVRRARSLGSDFPSNPTRIAGVIYSQNTGSSGDIEWDLERIQGVKNPGNQIGNGTGPWTSTAVDVAVPPVENLLTDAIGAAFRVDYRHNGSSLGDISISPTSTNDALGWSLRVTAKIYDDSGTYPHAAAWIQFIWTFSRAIGSDIVKATDLHLFADGTHTMTHRTVQASMLAAAQSVRRRRSTSMQAVEIASAIAGAVMTRILDNQGDVNWELDQLRGLKHVNDNPSNQGPASFQSGRIEIKDWPVRETGLGDQIYCNCEVLWQYNGRSLGNVQITATEPNDAVGHGLTVKAQIMDDANAYTAPGSAESFAAIKIRFHYRFTRSIGGDSIAINDVVLYGNGEHSIEGRWTLNASA